MGNRRNPERSESEAQIEREIRQGRKFSLGDAISRAAGPGVLKGESPVSRVRQAEVEIEMWLRSHLADAGGPLEVVRDHETGLVVAPDAGELARAAAYVAAHADEAAAWGRAGKQVAERVTWDACVDALLS